MAGTTWQALEVSVPGKDIIKQVNGVLETLVIFLDILKAILNTVKAFLSAVGNPIIAIVKAIIQLVTSLLNSLQQTGLYVWTDFPDFRFDPSAKRNAGGYPTFVQRWKGSLLDAQDINRPQPVPGFNSGGFVMIVADVEGPAKLIQLIKILKQFFRPHSVTTQYAAPANPRVVTIGSNGDAILQIAQFFSKTLTGLAVEWNLPSTTKAADPSFSGLVANLTSEFVPPKWLVERSSVPPTEITTDITKPGLLYTTVETSARDPRTNKAITKTVPVNDEFGQPVVLMENAYVINASTATATYIIGLLGHFRYLDRSVEKDKVYWYRVRALSGDLDWNFTTSKINFTPSCIVQDPNRQNSFYLSYPGSGVVMGQASPVMTGLIPTIPVKFDVYENLRAIFLSAFSFNFQEPPPPSPPIMVKDPVSGLMVQATDQYGNPVYQPLVNASGDPLQGVSPTIIGKGSLSAQAGQLSIFQAIPYVKSVNQLTAPTATATSDGPSVAWVKIPVRLQAGRLTATYASIMLSAGGAFIKSFQQFMQGPLPYPLDNADLIKAPSTLKGVNSLEGLVMALTKTTKPTALKWVTDSDTADTYGVAYYDLKVRKNLLAAVNFIKALGYQGQPPDWGRVALLQDVIPWSAQVLYEIAAKIQALVDAFNDVLKDVIAFIDMILRKIEVLEKFIEFLIMILNFIEQLSGGFYLLTATGLSNGVSDWFGAIDNAGGNPPKSTVQGGYTSGICLAYLLPDPRPVATAFKLIFGG